MLSFLNICYQLSVGDAQKLCLRYLLRLFSEKNTIFDLPIESFKIKLETINKIGLYMFHLRKRCFLWARKFTNKAIMYESTLKIYFSLEIIFSKSCVSILTAYNFCYLKYMIFLSLILLTTHPIYLLDTDWISFLYHQIDAFPCLCYSLDSCLQNNSFSRSSSFA